MSAHTYKKFEQVGSSDLPDKMTIYQDCMNRFNETPINAKRCRILISRLLRLLASGESFPESEATALFFSVSKLFQHPNDSLRQIVYLAIKELSGISEDVLMATSSIMKDVQNGSDLVKPNALRSLPCVLDESTAFSSERLLKSALVNRNPAISSAALCTSYHLLPISEATVKRFTNETQEAVIDSKQVTVPTHNSQNNQVSGHEFYPNSSYITQYHALGLLYQLKKNDKMALLKMVRQYSENSALKNQLAKIQLVKIVHQLILKDNGLLHDFHPILNQWLSNKFESVQLETSKLVTYFATQNARLVSPELFASAISTLQTLLTVPRVTTKFAALRVLNRISIVSPEHVVICNPELESLINDPNRNVATYAITTLLKTGTAKNVSSLISTITKFIHDVPDDFKVIIIDAMRTLSLNFPQEWKPILKFLMDILKNGEGGFKFKNSIVEAIIDTVSFVPQSKESALESLCDFIEDCEFNEILVRILHLLGKVGPTTSTPSLYVRHIYNRVVLENSIIRSAAVVALSKFAMTKNDPTLGEAIVALLKSISNDSDDEVRDRATIALKLIESVHDEKMSGVAEALIQPSTYYDLGALENKLSTYLHNNENGFKDSFDHKDVRVFTEDEIKANELKKKQEQIFDSNGKKKDQNSTNTEDRTDGSIHYGSSVNDDEEDMTSAKYAKELSSIDQFDEFGVLINSSKLIPLTESEAEFVVNCVKYVFKEHIVLQFVVRNTLTDIALSDVTVQCTEEQSNGAKLKEVCSIPIDILLPSAENSCYVAFSKSSEISMCTLTNLLTFTTREINPDTDQPFEDDEGFQDEFEIDSVTLTAGDYIKSSFVGNFSASFDELPAEETAVFNIQANLSLQEIVDKIIMDTNCLPLENTQFVPSESTTHTLKLFGKSALNGTRVALIVKMIKSSRGIALKAIGKGENATLVADIINNIA